MTCEKCKISGLKAKETEGFDHLQKLFEIEIYKKSKTIDEGENLDWFILTYGWAMGKGYTPEKAWDFASHIRYHTNLG